MLVEELIKLHEFIELARDGPGRVELEDRAKQQDIEKHLEDAERNIDETCKECVNDHIMLPKFAYQIRKQDT